MNSGQAVLVALAVLASTVHALAIIWATNRHVGLFFRFAPIAILLALWLPVGMVEFAGIFSAQLLVALALTFTVRLLRRVRRRQTSSQPIDRLAAQFSLANLLKWVLLFGLLMGLVINGPDEFRDGVWSWPGVVLAAITLTGRALGLVRGYWLLVFPVLAAILVVGILQALKVLPIPHSSNDASVLPSILIFVSGTTLAIAGSLKLIRAAGWEWSSRPALTPAAAPNAGIAPSAPSRFVRTARVSLVGLAILCVLPLANLYYALLPPWNLPTQVLPSPNGHTELVRLESQLNWSAIPQNDSDAATPAECERFVQDNADVLRSIEQALLLDSQVPIEWRETLSTHYGAMRTLYRVQDMRARAAIAAGNPREACECYVDAMRVALIASRGGLAADELTAAAIEKMAVEHLVPLLKDLDDDSLARLGRDAQKILNAREPPSGMLEREDLFERVSYGWQGRLYRWLHDWGLSEGYFDARVEMPKFRMRQDTDLELLIVETALFRYLLAHGVPPDSLSALVPQYFEQIPNDRYGTGPTVYRRTENGYLLYSVGENGVDDGGTPGSVDNRGLGDHLLLPP